MKKKVLNAGSGPVNPERLQRSFRSENWQEVRMDVDSRVSPDIVGSLEDLSPVADKSFDAVYCSHSLEHLHPHDVRSALRGIFRVLKQDGFALITSPDLEPVAALVAQGRGDEVAYQSPLGPITALDMIYGHAASIERGNFYMAHNSGFTEERIARLLLEARFEEVLVIKGNCYDFYALALMPQANRAEILSELLRGGLNFME
ncbi:methyltransferase domain-containing protein [Bradyrhizobium sp. Gha]|uniref:class I SAM-dependent methyltransferase n=1 Tax=Bradyrhizobium sp. Gha TaxID=1855318 RepID=UPI0008F44017|nr:methyltransferase domain-containing protein [Bradyrhizobium sp. Gha]SFI09290.1 Methyltransferase domain-containing protein [Bradyrhizobium sp. Gha]